MSNKYKLSNPRYKNWTKASLGIRCVRDGILSYIDNTVENQQQAFLDDIKQRLKSDVSICTQCCTENVIKCPTRGVCSNVRSCKFHNSTQKQYRQCPNKICDTIREEIEICHRYKSPSWKNTDATKWCTNHWEIAKCFMPLSGYSDKTSAQETDFAGIMSVFQNATFITIDTAITKKVKDIRNYLSHSADYELDDIALQAYLSDMISFLEVSQLSNLEEIDETKQCIKELMTDDYQISSSDEQKILKDLISSLVKMQLTEMMKEGQFAINRKVEEIECYLQRKYQLTNTLCEIYKDLRDMESPLLGDIDVNISEIFVDLALCDELINEPQKRKASDSFPSQSQQKRARNESESGYLDETLLKTQPDYDNAPKVNCYKDILYRQNKRCKNVYLLGNAGMGKTAWCIHVLNTWARVVTNLKQDKDSTLSEDEQALATFDAIFYVSLRHAQKNQVDILDMINEQLLSEYSEYQSVAKEVLRRDTARCLVLVDGLDEWSPPEDVKGIPQRDPSLPSRRDLHGVTVVTTTRPWKMLKLRNQAIDRAVKITGIRDKSVLAEKIIECLNEKEAIDATKSENAGCKATFEEFEATVQESNMGRIIEIPFLLIHLAFMWFKTRKLEKSFASNYSSLLDFIIDKGRSKVNSLKNISRYNTMRKTEAKKAENVLPDFILQNTRTCIKYSRFILRLSKLAFTSLLSKEKETSLVFSKRASEAVLDSIEIEIALQLGLLSQSKAFGRTYLSEISVSFLHKTFQEYFAAMFIVQSYYKLNHDGLNSYKEYCSNIDKCMEMEYILLFVSGMDGKVAREMTLHIASVLRKESKVNKDYVSRLTLLLSMCSHEIDSLTDGFSIFTENLVFSKYDTCDLKNIQCLLDCNAEHLRCLSIEFANDKRNSNNTQTFLRRCIDGLDSAEKLTFLTLSQISAPDVMIKQLTNALDKMPLLQHLHLEDIKCTCSERNCKQTASGRFYGLKSVRIRFLKEWTINISSLKSEDKMPKKNMEIQQPILLPPKNIFIIQSCDSCRLNIDLKARLSSTNTSDSADGVETEGPSNNALVEKIVCGHLNDCEIKIKGRFDEFHSYANSNCRIDATICSDLISIEQCPVNTSHNIQNLKY